MVGEKKKKKLCFGANSAFTTGLIWICLNITFLVFQSLSFFNSDILKQTDCDRNVDV